MIAGAGFNGNRINGVINSQAGFASNGNLQGSFYDWGAALLLRQPLFDGGRAQGAAMVAEKEGAVLQADAELTKQQIRETVASSWQNIKASTSVNKAGLEAVNAATKALNDAQLRYRAQVESLTEVLLVQRDLQAARAALLSGQIQQALNRALLVRETGSEP